MDLQQIIDNVKSSGEIKIDNEINMSLSNDGCCYVGDNFSKSMVTITKSNILLDFSGTVLRINISDPLDTNLDIFFIASMAKNVVIKNLRMVVYVNCSVNNHQIVGIYNTAFGLKLINCHIELISEQQLSLIGVFNTGGLNTHLETRADNLVIDNCFIKTQVLKSGLERSETYGLYNYLANSISVQNTYIYSINIGMGEQQKAVGVYTNGRFGRFIANNFKANASHSVGNLKEQAYAYGFINEGLYNLIEANNIVGEWGGQCIGLENKGNFAKVNGNKILATHTIKGRSVRNFSDDCVFDGNILTSTSRNPRLFEHEGCNCIIVNNIMEGLQPAEIYQSSVGIYAINKRAKGNVISQNIIKNICDVGIYVNENIGIIKNNIITTYDGIQNLIKEISLQDLNLDYKLDEKKISSISE